MAEDAPSGSSNRVKNIGVIAVLGVIATIIAVALGPGLYKDWQQGRVLETGVEAPARIVDIIDTGNRYNSNPEVRILLEVEPEGGQAYRAEQNTVMSPVDLARFKPGQDVVVRYDPEDPSLVAIVGL